LKQVDDHLLDDPYEFPCVVKVYVVEKGFKQIESVKIDSWEKYNLLRYSYVMGSNAEPSNSSPPSK